MRSDRRSPDPFRAAAHFGKKRRGADATRPTPFELLDAVFFSALDHARHVARAARGAGSSGAAPLWSVRIGLVTAVIGAVENDRRRGGREMTLAAYVALAQVLDAETRDPDVKESS